MAARILNLKDQLNLALHDASKPWTGILDNIEIRTGVDRLYIFVATIAVIGLWLVFGFAGQLICNTISFVYPAYVSMHAIESPQKDDDTKWLTYWVVFAIFSLGEYFADFLVGWFPLYWLAKCVFFIWLMIPTDFNGSLFLYAKVIRPYFLKHRAAVDKVISKVLEKEN